VKKYTTSFLHIKTADVLDEAIVRPVMITKYSKPSYVLMSMREYEKVSAIVKEERKRKRGKEK
jgi:prevent-host-death family protein